MSTPVIANARTMLAAPVRKPRAYGLLSVANVIDGGDPHWMIGGLMADGEECSKPYAGTITCGPTPNKSMRSWYSDIEGEPWLTYMMETCKTVGRLNEAAAKTRARFEAAEQSAVEAGFQDNILTDATVVGTGAFASVPLAIAHLEDFAASEYGGQIILHLPFIAAQQASSNGFIQQVGDHLETISGNLVSIGNYHPDHDGGTAAAPVVYATGAINLYRGELVDIGPVIDYKTNDYFVLVERAYGALVDCFMASATGTVCGCGGAAVVGQQSGDDDDNKPHLDEGSSMSASALGITCADSNAQTAANLNAAGIRPNPQTDWGSGNCASVDCGGDIDREVRWSGTSWVGC